MILNFRHWFLLRENFDATAYDDLFNRELDAVLPMVSNPEDRHRLAAMRGGWSNYVAASLRNAGFREQGDLEEKLHDLVVRLLISPGGLFKNYDQTRHGPIDLRFKRSVANAVKNLAEREKSRRNFLRPVANHAVYVPDAAQLPARPEQEHDATIIDGFRNLLRRQCGDLAVAIFDARLEHRQTKDLVGLPELDRPSQYIIKRMVQEIKTAAVNYAKRLDDPEFLRRVEGLLDAEAATVARRITTSQRRRVGTS